MTIFVFDKLVVGLKTFDKSGKKRSSSTKKGRDPHVKKISSLATAHTIFKIIIKTLAKKIHTLQIAFPFLKLFHFRLAKICSLLDRMLSGNKAELQLANLSMKSTSGFNMVYL